MKHRVFGIDLGTTYSAVAAYDTYTDQAEIIPNRQDRDEVTTPSVVGLDPSSGKVIVGRAAKNNLPFDPDNTIIEIKREMGELFRTDSLQKYGGSGTFNEGDPVKVRFAEQWLLPQEVSAFILMKMKEIAEQEIGEEIRDAVITVPAYFHATQRKATEEAALLAGLYPRQLIPEPTAAAICYGVDRFDPERHVYLVYDLGGGTFDVSIIDVQEDQVTVVATSGDARLGGGDFDDKITEWAIRELRDKFQLDFSQDAAARARIKHHAEAAKIRLSTFETTELSLTELSPERAPKLTLTREVFEKLIEPFVKKSRSAVEEAIKLAEDKKGYRRDDITAILLVGGSTNIPAVKRMLLDYFEREEEFVRDDLDPAGVVARGAATLAHRFAPTAPPFDLSRRPDSMNIETDVDAIPLIAEHSLGVAVKKGGEVTFDKLVERGTNIPVSEERGGYTNEGPTTDVEVRVYQGESEHLHENTLIGTVHLGPIEPREAGFHKFEVTFALDVNGLLSVTVVHVNTGKSYQARFEHETSAGGDEALTAMRSKLLGMYQPGSMLGPRQEEGVAAEESNYVPPPPGGAAEAAAGGAEPAAAEAAAEGADAAVAGAAEAVAEGADAAAAGAAETAAEGVDAADAAAGSANEESATIVPSGPDGPLDPTRDVPDEFKSIARRARRYLLEQESPALLAAYNAFVTALNEERDEDELIDLGDALGDAYVDTRHRPS